MSIFKEARTLYFGVLIVLILGIDQLTKTLVRNTMYVGESIFPGSPVRLTYIQNTGSAFGLFQDQTLILTIVAGLGILFICCFFFRGSATSTLIMLSLSMQLSGAIGNLIDRIAYGYVVDFVDFRVWPIFNVADSSITLGFLLLAFILLLGKDTKRIKNEASAK